MGAFLTVLFAWAGGLVLLGAGRMVWPTKQPAS
jgi:hypothetical protein